MTNTPKMTQIADFVKEMEGKTFQVSEKTGRVNQKDGKAIKTAFTNALTQFLRKELCDLGEAVNVVAFDNQLFLTVETESDVLTIEFSAVLKQVDFCANEALAEFESAQMAKMLEKETKAKKVAEAKAKKATPAKK